MSVSNGSNIVFLLTVPKRFLCCRKFFFVCASVASYLAFDFSLFVPSFLPQLVPQRGCAS